MNWLPSFKKKRRNLKSKELRAEYYNMIEHAVIGIYIIQDNFFRYVNTKWTEIHGYKYEEVVDKLKPEDLVFIADRQIVKQNIEKRLSGEFDSLEFEFRGLRKGGDVIWVRVLGKKMDYKGRPAIHGTIADITKQKESEMAMRISEERLRITLESTQIGIWDWDVEKDIWYASPIYYTMLGYNPISSPSDRTVWMNRIHPDDRDMVREKINGILSQKQNQYIYEARMLHADGSYRWHQVIGHVINKDNQGNIKRMVGIRKDVTGFKLAEERLKKSEGRLRTLIDTIPDLVWLKDPKGVYLQCNHRFEQFYGTQEKGIVGKTDYDFVSKELADFFRKKDKDAISAGKPSINEEKVTFADGHKETLETIKTPIYEEDGKLVGVLGIGRDITERKKAEQDLRKSEARVRSLLETIPDVVWLKNSEGIFLQCNKRFEILLGMTEKDIVGKTDYDFLSKEEADFFRQKDLEAIATGKPIMNEEEVTFADGHKEILETIKTPIFEENKKLLGVLGIGRDITEKKKNEKELEKHRQHLELLVQERTEELQASLEELHAANEELMFQKEELQNTIDVLNSTRKQLVQSEKMASLGLLAAGIAHEINNPLNFIHGGSVALKMYFDRNLKANLNEVSPLFDAINEGVKRASQIVTSLNHYSRKDEESKVKCDIHAIIDNCVTILWNKIKSKVKIRKKYTEKAYTFFGNEGKLHQALLNIIANAEQAIKKEGNIDIVTDVLENQFIIEIKDYGEGMSSETMDKIFDPFFTTKITGEGTGLGLSITYNIIQEHNGKIKYKSNLGEGTKAIITLPLNITKT